MPLMTRKKLAGVVLALALAGALSAGVASGVERVRGKVKRRPPAPPPFSQRDEARASPRVHAHPGAQVAAAKREALEPVAVASEARSYRSEVPARPERSAVPVQARAAHAGGWSEAVEPDQDAHGHGAPVAGLTARIPAPMRVGWTVVESVAGQVRLVAKVERRMGFGAPVKVSLSLPGGATLLEGPAEFTVPGGPGGDVQAVPYVVTFGAGGLPAEDLVLVAHAEGRSFGAHAEARHGFGRVSPDRPRPVPTGPTLPASLMSGTRHDEHAQDEELP